MNRFHAPWLALCLLGSACAQSSPGTTGDPTATPTGDCDGQTDDGLLPTWYGDGDGDGYGGPDAIEACAMPFGFASVTGDCDDASSDIHPDAAEVVDGVDNDCDGVVDTPRTDTATDTGTEPGPDVSYRLPIRITGASVDLEGPPLLVNVDLSSALVDAGVTEPVETRSIRVVYEPTAGAPIELPSQFLDGVWGLDAKVPSDDPIGDGVGTVAFLHDTDGDPDTIEILGAGETVFYYLTFGTEGVDATYPTDLQVEVGGLSNGRTKVVLDPSRGGLVSTLSIDGSPVLTSQTDGLYGNGVNTRSQTWMDTPLTNVATSVVVADGPVVAIVTADTQMADYDARYTFWMFDRHPELWVKAWVEITDDTQLQAYDDAVETIRPWQSVQSGLTAPWVFTDDPAGAWAHVSDGTWGIGWGYREPPRWIHSTSNYDPYFISRANDAIEPGGPANQGVPAGTTLIDHTVMAVFPHAGPYAAIEGRMAGLLEGVQWETLPVETVTTTGTN